MMSVQYATDSVTWAFIGYLLTWIILRKLPPHKDRR